MSSPVKIRELPEETDKLLRSLFKGHPEGFLQFGDEKYMMPRRYREHAGAMRATTLRPDDVWVASFPRCGTTWTQELVWLLKQDLDYKKAAETNLNARYFFIDRFALLNEQKPGLEALLGIDAAQLKSPGYQFAETLPSPRFFKTHLPLSLLPPSLLDTCKMVYVARDPRDVAVSFYHLNKRFKGFDFLGDFKTYWDLFRNDLILYSPFWARTKEAWSQRHHPNMLFMFNEDMIQNLPAAVKRVSTFLGKEYSKEQLQKLCDHLDFKNFKNNVSVNNQSLNQAALVNKDSSPFIRQGKAGGWREHFDADMQQQAHEWMQSHLQDTDLRFPQMN